MATYIDLVTESLNQAAQRCGVAHARVQELEDERALIKPQAIKRLIESGAATSVTAAERIVETDAEYAAHRIKQREAEVERWAALGEFEAAKFRARVAESVAHA